MKYLDFKNAVLNKIKTASDPDEIKILRTALAAIQKKAKDQKITESQIPEDLVNEVLLKEVKEAQESLDACSSTDERNKTYYTYRKDILKQYAPSVIEDEKEIKDIINSLNIELVKANRGKLNKAVASLYKNKINMRKVNEYLSRALI